MGLGDFISDNAGSLISGSLGALGSLGAAAAGAEDPELTEAKIDLTRANIEDIKQRLLLERDKLAFEQQKAGFNADLQKRQLEIELALATIQKQEEATPSRELEIAVNQANMQQRSADTQGVQAALANVARSGR